MAVRKIADAQGDANRFACPGRTAARPYQWKRSGVYGGSDRGRTPGAKARVPDSIVGDRTAGTRRVGRSVAAVGASGRPEGLPCVAGRMKARYSEIFDKKITFVLFTTDYETKTSIYESLVLAGLLCRSAVALLLRPACCAGLIGRYRAPSRNGRSFRRGVRSEPVDEDMPVVRRHDAVAQRRFLQRIAATFARPRAESRNGSLRRFRRDPRRAGRSGARSL